MTRQLAVTLDIAGEAQNQGLQGAENHGASDGGFSILLGNLFSAIMLVAVLLVLGFFLWGAIEWITSGGDKSKVEGARNKITNAAIGLIVLAATTAVFLLIEEFLGIDLLTFN